MKGLPELPGGLEELPERFWVKVDTAGEVKVAHLGRCWEWTSTRNRPGRYGHFTIQGRKYLAHRLAWVAHRGGIPDRMILDHKCGNPICVRVDHLQLTTQALNTQNLRRLYSSNKTGIRGVSWNKSQGKYVAQASIQGRRISLGYFDDPEEAGRIAANFRRQHYKNSLSDLEEAK